MSGPTRSGAVSQNVSFEVVSSGNSSFEVLPMPKELEYRNGKETLFDEEEVKVPFPFLGGERDSFKGCSVDGYVVITNYRFYHEGYGGDHLINVPLGLIGHIEKSGGVLFIFCKSGQSYSLAFHLKEIDIWVERIQSKLNHLEMAGCFAFSHFLDSKKQEDAQVSVDVTSKNENTASNGKDANFDTNAAAPVNGKCASNQNQNGTTSSNLLAVSEKFEQGSLMKDEAKRMNFNLKETWRISKINEEYELCPSYPRHLITPHDVSDDELRLVAKYRRIGRIPAVVWRHRINGSVIARCSQPLQGWAGSRSPADESLVSSIRGACVKDSGKEMVPNRLLIVDARSFYAALGNRLNVGGHENVKYYDNCDIEFMDIANIHEVRKSLDSIATLCVTPDHKRWLSQLEYTNWLSHISSIIKAASTIVKAIEDDGRPVLVHCSDGWDRTSQLTSLSQLMLDPYYRTVEGFQTVVEREWLGFGHKFADRCVHSNGHPQERSPVFLQWLDCVFQLQQQYPFHFEFNEQYLMRLVYHTYSCLFGTFLFNRDQDRRRNFKVHERTYSVWPALKKTTEFYNHFYVENDEVLRPSCQIRNLNFWSNIYVQEGSINQNTFQLLPFKEVEAIDKSANTSDEVLRRKTSSPKEDLDLTKSNPLETSDIPEVVDTKLADASITDTVKEFESLPVGSYVKCPEDNSKLVIAKSPEDNSELVIVKCPEHNSELVIAKCPNDDSELVIECPDEEDTELSSSFFAPIDMLSSILPNVYSMYTDFYNMVPSFPFYNSMEEPEAKIPEVELVQGKRSRHTSLSRWVFEVEKQNQKKSTRVLDFDGLFIQEDVASVMARRLTEKCKAAFAPDTFKVSKCYMPKENNVINLHLFGSILILIWVYLSRFQFFKGTLHKVK